ncbi:MAG: putative Ig domain-containing protein, partial [Nitrospira sp.]|nr:putative Ig domain-containing protein [Nitrospira sp.]
SSVLTFSLGAGAPAEATIDPTTGLFTWSVPRTQPIGFYSITVHVTDAGTPALTDSQTFTVEVLELTNTPPTLDPIGNKTVDEETTLSFTISATDLDLPAQPLTYSTTGLPVGATFNAATREFVWRPAETQGGADYVVTFSVTDGEFSASETITITVNEVNKAPVLDPIGNQTVNEGELLSFIISGSDSDLSPQPSVLTYSATGLPLGATFDAITREFVWTPSETQGPGSYQVTFSVTDGVVTTSELVTITVNEVNVAPVLAPIGNKSINEETELRFTISGSDVDDPAQTLIYSATDLPLGATFDASTREFVWKPTEVQGPGSYAVIFSVTDGVVTTSELVTISVNEVNVAPVLAPIGNKSVNEETELRFTISGSDVDDPAQTLVYSATGLPTGATFDAITREFVWTPTENQGPGSYAVTFTVTDGVVSTSETITISVNEVNVAPVLNAIGNKSINEQTELRFTISGSDVDVPAQTLVYSVTGLPLGATFDPLTREFVWTPSETQGPGSYDVTFNVTDGSLSASETITITVNEVNVAPVLNTIGNKSINEETELRFTISGSDVDDPFQPLTYSATGLPLGATFNPLTREFVWTPSETQGPGSYDVTFNVTDGSLSASETITITVGEVNVAPVLAPIGNQTVNEETELRFTISGSDVDDPAQVLTYSATGLPLGATFDAITREFVWTPSELQGPGSYAVTFSVTDGALTTGETITITVNEVNVAPVLNTIGNKTVNEETELRFNISGSDVDDPLQTLVYSATGLPLGATFDAITREFVWTPTENQGPGSYAVTFTVTDGVVSTSETITISVNEVNVAPVLAPIGNKTVNEGELLSFTVSASDVDVPTQLLTFSAAGLPAGATFDVTTGLFAWTPTENQGPGSYAVTFSVTDGALTTSETITITVNEVNVAPVLNAIGNKTVNEETELRFTISGSDVDDPAQVLVYSATGLPLGATFDALTREFVWTPAENQGPGSYAVTFSVTDG